MGLTDRIRKIVLEEVQQVSRFKDVLRFWLGLFYHVAQKAWEDSFAQRAAALAFFTLLNFLPIVGILLFVLSHSPIFKENMASVERVLVEQLVTPAARQVVIDLFASISKNLYVLGSGASGVLAILILLFLGTSLLRMVERSLNEIFRSPDAKGAILSRTIYLWAAVTLLPVFLGLSFALSRHVRHALGGALAVFQYLLPYGVTFAGFILLYRFIPKARVKMKAVLIAALFSSILWETAKLGLSAYVQEVFSRSPVSRLYGSLALIPIGMVWIYYSWIIVLLGAELAYVLHNFEQMQVEARKRWRLGKGFVPLSRQVAAGAAPRGFSLLRPRRRPGERDRNGVRLPGSSRADPEMVRGVGARGDGRTHERRRYIAFPSAEDRAPCRRGRAVRCDLPGFPSIRPRADGAMGRRRA